MEVTRVHKRKHRSIAEQILLIWFNVGDLDLIEPVLTLGLNVSDLT